MPEFRYIPPDEMARRHRTRGMMTPSRQPRQPEHKNVEVVLSLGDVRYILFHGNTYRVAPVPFKLGERVLDSHSKLVALAKKVAVTGDKKMTDQFYRQMAIQSRLLWQHIRPSGKVRRFFWRLGLMYNPFRDASEKEITELTNFFLQCRMTSSVQFMPATTATNS